jgi:AraC-like DNA-binding protein
VDAQVAYSSPLVTAMRLTCDLHRSGPGPSYGVRETWIGFGLSGVFSLYARGEEHVIHPGIAAIFPRGLDYKMSHPNDDGDTSLALGFAPEVVEEALGQPMERIAVSGLDLRMRYDVGLLMGAIERREDQLAVDEMALDLLRAVAQRAGPLPVASTPARRRVDRARQLLAERPEAPWRLDRLARAVGCSPFHLAHQFRAYTGTSVHRYLADLRSAVALRRLEAGDVSLAAVAVDLGFAHHSHLTWTLRRRLGVTPRMIRARLRGTSY